MLLRSQNGLSIILFSKTNPLFVRAFWPVGRGEEKGIIKKGNSQDILDVVFLFDFSKVN